MINYDKIRGNMMDDNYKYSEITDKIIRGYYNVYNKLGYGFLEKVYEHAMMLELPKFGLDCKNQVPIKVYYDFKSIGEYFADILVDNLVIVELKAAENLCEEHECQLINYLRATELEVGLLLNFGRTPQFKRKVLTIDRKNLNKS
jgi:GxxExxY protein